MKKVLFFAAFAFQTGFITAQTVTIGSGTRVDSNVGLSAPISIYYGYSLSQQLYTASEIGGPMTIKTLQFYLKPSSQNVFDNSDDQIDIWIGHTPLNGFPASTATGPGWIPVSQQQHSLVNGSFTVSNDIVTFVLDTPFVYNGTDNLVITVDANEPGHNGATHPFYQTTDQADFVTLINRNDTVNPDPANPPMAYGSPTATTDVQAKLYKAIITMSSNILSVSDVQRSNEFQIFPNPATDYIDVLAGKEIKTVEIFDAKGSKVWEGKLINKSVDIRRLTSGTYMVKVNFKDGESTTKKIIKK